MREQAVTMVLVSWEDLAFGETIVWSDGVSWQSGRTVDVLPTGDGWIVESPRGSGNSLRRVEVKQSVWVLPGSLSAGWHLERLQAEAENARNAEADRRTLLEQAAGHPEATQQVRRWSEEQEAALRSFESR